jgi:hypothetical protein
LSSSILLVLQPILLDLQPTLLVLQPNLLIPQPVLLVDDRRTDRQRTLDKYRINSSSKGVEGVGFSHRQLET